MPASIASLYRKKCAGAGRLDPNGNSPLREIDHAQSLHQHTGSQPTCRARLMKRKTLAAPGHGSEQETPWLARLGPGVVTGAADDDPRSIATYSQAGAGFGLNMLWTVHQWHDLGAHHGGDDAHGDEPAGDGPLRDRRRPEGVRLAGHGADWPAPCWRWPSAPYPPADGPGRAWRASGAWLISPVRKAAPACPAPPGGRLQTSAPRRRCGPDRPAAPGLRPPRC